MLGRVGAGYFGGDKADANQQGVGDISTYKFREDNFFGAEIFGYSRFG